MTHSISGGPAAIREALRNTKAGAVEVRLLQRLYGLLLVAEGRSGAEVARWFGVDAHTVTRWVQAYARQGLVALRERTSGGRPTALSDVQLRQLAALLANGQAGAATDSARWTGKRLQDHIDRHYGVILSVRQCQRLLHRLCQQPSETRPGQRVHAGALRAPASARQSLASGGNYKHVESEPIADASRFVRATL